MAPDTHAGDFTIREFGAGIMRTAGTIPRRTRGYGGKVFWFFSPGYGLQFNTGTFGGGKNELAQEFFGLFSGLGG